MIEWISKMGWDDMEAALVTQEGVARAELIMVVYF